MSPDRSRGVWDGGEVVFRTLAAPGLEEDDLFAARHGPGAGVLWGEGLPSAFPPAEEPPDADAERRRRHEELLERWDRPEGVPDTDEEPAVPLRGRSEMRGAAGRGGTRWASRPSPRSGA